MSFVPKEIFSLIDPNNVSLFLTCQNFYQFVDMVYRKIKFDCSTNPIVLTSDAAINQIVIPEYFKNIYTLINVTVVPYKFQNIKHIFFDDFFNKNVDGLNYLPPRGKNIDIIDFWFQI
jgi:hypothetical protein